MCGPDADQLMSTCNTRESLLLRLRKDGDESAWNEFYQIYGRLIFGYALHYQLSHAEAEDVVQEVCLKVVRRIGQFDYSPQKGRFRGWLRAITRNCIIDYIRRRQGKQKHADAYLRHMEREWAAEEKRDEEIWRLEWEKALFEQALVRVKQRVDKQTFVIFKRYVLDDLSASTVAEETTLDANAVYAVKFRILQYIREEVAQIIRDEQDD